jgi:hypothetical protein
MDRIARGILLAAVTVMLAGLSFADGPKPDPVPQLISVNEKANTSGLVITFNFDTPIRALTNSTANWQLTKQGSAGPTQSVAATLDGAQPNSISVPISWQDCVGFDTVSVFVSLVDQEKNTITTTPKVSRDLTVYGLITDAQKTVAGLQLQLTQAKSDNAAVTRILVACENKVVPSRVDFIKADLITDDRVVLTFRTDIPGIVMVTRDDDPTTKQIGAIETEHRVLFGGMAAETTHHFKAVVLDFNNKPTDKTAETSETTLARMPDFTPTISITPAAPERIDVKVILDPTNAFTSDLKAAVEVDYKQVISTNPIQYGPAKVLNRLALDKFNIPTGGLSSSGTSSITDLQPGATYSVAVRIVNQYGQSHAESPVSEDMPPKPIPLAFDGAVAIQITPTGGISATWTSNSTPKEAHLQVLFGTTTTVDEKAKLDEANPKHIQITAPVGGLQQVLNQTLNGGTPIIKLMMSDANGTVDRQFTFSFVLPNVSSKGSPAAVSASDTTAAVQKIASASQTPTKNKISWQDILAAGIGIVIKAAGIP